MIAHMEPHLKVSVKDWQQENEIMEWATVQSHLQDKL